MVLQPVQVPILMLGRRKWFAQRAKLPDLAVAWRFAVIHHAVKGVLPVH
ncbi:MAG: hypothetical protein AAGC71_02575 [Pseudomonadota bacterium]